MKKLMLLLLLAVFVSCKDDQTEPIEPVPDDLDVPAPDGDQYIIFESGDDEFDFYYQLLPLEYTNRYDFDPDSEGRVDQLSLHMKEKASNLAEGFVCKFVLFRTFLTNQTFPFRIDANSDAYGEIQLEELPNQPVQTYGPQDDRNFLGYSRDQGLTFVIDRFDGTYMEGRFWGEIKTVANPNKRMTVTNGRLRLQIDIFEH